MSGSLVDVIVVREMIGLTLVSSLLLWRLWSFTILPWLFPFRPKTLPYWIPWIGHTIGFVRNADRTVEHARLYFGNTRRPFALVVCGQTVYVVTSAQDVTSTFRNVDDLAFDDFVKGLLTRAGSSLEGVGAMFDKPARNSPFFKSNPQSDWADKPLSFFSERIIRSQLISRDQQKVFQTAVLRYAREQLRFETIPKEAIVAESHGEKIVSLHAWTRTTLLKAMTTAMYGTSLLTIDPLFLQTFHHFDVDSWKLTFKIPALFAPRLFAAKGRLQRAFDTYYDMPAEQRADACWMIKALEAEMRAEGHSSTDVSAYLLLLYWVINSNAWKATFWMVSHVLYDPVLRTAIEHEILPLTAAAGPLPTSLPALQGQLEKCPLLTATFYETLRVATSSISAREVVREAIIGNLRFQPGTRVIVPSRQTLIDSAVFGLNPKSFDANRFLENPGLVNSSSFRPFGGGISYCPGRFMAQAEVMGFTVELLREFEVEVVKEGPWRFPKMDTAKPCLGVMDAVEGEDLLLKVRKKGV